MPNQTLIDQLDALRERYIQQQKAAAALQKSLKAFIDAQNKAEKTLRDYRVQNTGADTDAAQAAFAQIRLKEDAIDPLLPDLRREIKSLAALANALKEASGALYSAPVDVVRLDRAVTHLRSVGQQNVLDLIQELDQELEIAQRALGDEFGAKLRGALAEQGVAINGRAPKFEIGRFELEANFARRFITLRYGKDVVVPRAPITVEAALKAYQNAAKSVMGYNQNGQAWMGQFYEAYHRARRKLDISGARVNLVDCYVEMAIYRQSRAFYIEPSKRTFSDYNRSQFVYDFYEFTNRQHLAYDGQVVKAHAATKSQTDSAAKSMWIVEGDTPYDGRYIADVEFVKD